jgi:hypothetical protein
MTQQELLTYLSDGLDDANKTKLNEIFANPVVAARSVSLRQQTELDAILTERQGLLDTLDAVERKPDGTISPKGYRAWYNHWFPKIQENDTKVAKYEEKYGPLDNPKVPVTTNPNPVNPQTGKQYTDDDIKKIIREEFQTSQAPNISSVIKNAGSLIQRHMYAGRKTAIPFDELEQKMTEAQKKGQTLTLDQAYDEWDKPEREKELKAAEDARVEQRVTEELQKRGSVQGFPAGADYTPGPMSRHADADKFDSGALKNELARDLYKVN